MADHLPAVFSVYPGNSSKPLDPRVKLTQVPGKLKAALSYSDTWSRGRYEGKEKRLQELIRQRGLKISGEPVFARYNPPFMPGFLRRNEVLLPVARQEDMAFRGFTGIHYDGKTGFGHRLNGICGGAAGPQTAGSGLPGAGTKAIDSPAESPALGPTPPGGIGQRRRP